MLRKILAGLGFLVLLLVVAVLLLYLKFRPSIRAAEARSAEQDKMLLPRVVIGEGEFKKHAFYIGNGLGNISQVRVGWPASREGADIAVVGSQGADFITVAGEFKKQVRFSIEQRAPIEVVRIDSTGDYGYLTRNESWAVPVTLFDKAGNVSWRSQKNWPGVNDSASGDINGDGKLSVVVGFNGAGGIILLNADGKESWKRDDGNVWQVETLDINGDGHDEIIHSNARGQLLVRDGNGNVVATYLPCVYVSHFSLIRWGKEVNPTHILVPISQSDATSKPALVILDAHGEKVKELDSPMGDLFDRFNAIPIQFRDGAEYSVVLDALFWKNRSMLLVYDEKGHIVYQEILADSCMGMAALRKKDVENLLLGCSAKVWEFSPVRRSETSAKKVNK